jgi:hypothetical protein
MARDRPEARRLEPAPMSNAHDRIPTLAILPVVVSAVPCPIVLSMLERRRLDRIRLVFCFSYDAGAYAKGRRAVQRIEQMRGIRAANGYRSL